MKPERRAVAVTGGTRGIGFTVAKLFLNRGYNVGVCSRSSPETGLPAGILHCTADVRKREDLGKFVSAVVGSFGRLDVFVNNAGISRWRAVGDIDEPFVAEMIGTNILGTLWGCSAAAHVLKPGGCIINVSSLAGKRGSANNTVYCAAKFAVNGMTQALAKELGGRGIRVNAVCPVYVETETILESLAERDSPASSLGVRPYLANFAATQTALGRLPSASEVAETVFFLASEMASAITGQCLNVDCGALPQ